VIKTGYGSVYDNVDHGGILLGLSVGDFVGGKNWIDYDWVGVTSE
jgi:hypothetical protein